MKKIFLVVCCIGFFFACSSNSQKENSKTADVKRLSAKGEMPVLAWSSISNDETSIKRFQELRDCGFTHSFGGYPDNESMARALDTAHAVRVKLFIATPELKKEPEETVKRFMDHPATAGYFLRDEPPTSEFEMLGKWARRIESVDSTKDCYLNLYPNYGRLHIMKADNYQEYVDRFDKEVDLSLLSFDYYPIIEDDKGNYSLRDGFYSNLEVFMKKGQEVNKPFWAFALATAHRPYPIPTMGHLRLQMFSNLAYGAQGLQYFTYFTPKDTTVWNFHQGPIDRSRKRTEIYDYIKEMNKEIQGLSPVFIGAEVISVRHIGETIPDDTKRLEVLPTPIKSISCEGAAGAIISHLKNDGREFLVIVNRDFENKMMLDIQLDPIVDRVMKDGTLVSSELYSSKMGVEPGDILVYTWE